MKKITFIFLMLFAFPSTYIFVDYVSFKVKSANTVKKILIVSEHFEQKSVRAKIYEAIKKAAEANKNITTSLVDVTALGFSFIDAQDAPAQKPSNDPAVQRWSLLVTEADAIIFLILNYNNGYPAGIKNAIDVLWKEWHNKPVGVVTY